MRAEGDNILIIKHGALGDFVQALGAMRGIRANHPGAYVTLLTTPMLADFAETAPYFDAVITDTRAPLWHIPTQWRLRRKLLQGRFRRVYDLQTSQRTGFYYRLWPARQRPEWSGAIAGCSHPHLRPDRRLMHGLDRLSEQLAIAGISPLPEIDLSWAEADLTRFSLPERFALLVPGAAEHRVRKRWPATHYAEIAQFFLDHAVQPVVIGTQADRNATAVIERHTPQILNLTGQTDLTMLATLARSASIAVGNDTGPMHMIAAAGVPALVLFSDDSDPARNAPRGDHVHILQRADLADLPVLEVSAALDRLCTTSS